MQIEVKDLCFSYGAQPVLEHVSFSVPEGSMTAVLGPNGAGKSTLFRCLLGLLRPQRGQVTIGTQALGSLSRRALAQLAAYVPQAASPTFQYTVLDTVLMGTSSSLSLLERPGRAEQERALQALERLGIAALADKSIANISGGERQLVLLARALVQQARLLIMNEPTANLDFGNQQRVLSQITALTRQGYTVLLSTHHPDHALRYCSHTLALHNGRVCAFGETGQVLTAGLIETLYGVHAELVTLQTPTGPVQSCVPI